MSYDVVLTASFKRSLKPLQKRYPRVKQDVRIAIRTILETPHLGVVISGSGGVRKLRLRNSDLRRGKSGGYRLLYLLEELPSPRIYLILLYAKSDREDVTRQELQELLVELTG